MSKLIPSFIVFGLLSFTTQARSPAIDPIMAPSIEEYKEVPPEKAKGYNFNRKPSSNAKPVHGKHDQEGLKVESAHDTHKSVDMLALFFILLPIVASSFAYYRFKIKSHIIEEDQHHAAPDEHHDDDIDFPKAS